MKCFAAVLALVAAFAVNASAADYAVKSSCLSKMGLSGMTAVSDDVGMTVRGKGFAASAGFSISHSGNFTNGTTAGNGTVAVSGPGTPDAAASTSNYSVAGTASLSHFNLTVTVTGGASGGSAYAK